jgi:hypothetical protein
VLGLGRGRREGREPKGEKREWAGVAHAGRGRGKGELGWARRRFGCLALSLFLFLYPIYSNKLFEFKIQFEFKHINSTQIKQCCSMNAQTL